MDTVPTEADFRTPDIPNASPQLPSSSSPLLGLSSSFHLFQSSDDVLRLLNASAGANLSKVWKNGPSVQLLVPPPAQQPQQGNCDPSFGPSCTPVDASELPNVRRPANAYQLFCDDWRPVLKQLTRIASESRSESERERVIARIKDLGVQESLRAAPMDATLSTLLGLAWKKLSQSEKEKYEDRSSALMELFKQEHANWRLLLRSPMIAMGGSAPRKRKRSNSVVQQQQQQHQAVSSPTVSSPKGDPQSNSDDEDEEYQEPSFSRSAKRQRPNKMQDPSHQLLSGKANVPRPSAPVCGSDWAHLFQTLMSANQSMTQLPSGSPA